MTVKEAREKNITLVLPNGTPLTENELIFLDAIETLEEQYGAATVSALRTFLELIVEKSKK